MNKSNSPTTYEIYFAPSSGAKMRHLEVGIEIWETRVPHLPVQKVQILTEIIVKALLLGCQCDSM